MMFGPGSDQRLKKPLTGIDAIGLSITGYAKQAMSAFGGNVRQ